MVLDLTPEQRAFKESIEQFARETVAPQAARIDASGEFPLDVMRAAAGMGLLGVTIPPAWGGAGRDYVSYALAIETVARASATVAASLVVTNSLVAEVIAHAGSDPQKDQWLRALAAGEAIGAFALSEPDAGTDAANQQTTAVRSGDGYRIRGRKVWVANAEAARIAIVFAATMRLARLDRLISSQARQARRLARLAKIACARRDRISGTDGYAGYHAQGP